MTDPVEVLNALALRCEEATGPDRELDDAIARTVGICLHEDREVTVLPADDEDEDDFPGFAHRCRKCGDRRGMKLLPKSYTASLDAAMTLIPEGWEWSLDNCGSETFGPWNVEMGDPARFHPVEGRTAALALCAAALRARAHLLQE